MGTFHLRRMSAVTTVEQLFDSHELWQMVALIDVAPERTRMRVLSTESICIDTVPEFDTTTAERRPQTPRFSLDLPYRIE